MAKGTASLEAESIPAVDRQLLIHSPLTADLKPAMVERLAALARPKTVSRSDFLFFPGNRARSFYLVLEGKIKVFYPDQEGRECIIRIAGSSDILCLAAVFGHRTYQAIGEAISACRVLAFSGDCFMEFMQKEPTLTGNVLRILSLRIEGIGRKQCLARNLPAPAQVAHYLMERSTECNRCGCCPLDLRPFHVTAQEIGIARETLSRIIGQMKKEGIVDCCRGCITIRNQELIKNIACCMQGWNQKNTKYISKKINFF